MKTYLMLLVLLCSSLLLSACVSTDGVNRSETGTPFPTANLNIPATETAIAEKIYATLTATAPQATQTPRATATNSNTDEFNPETQVEVEWVWRQITDTTAVINGTITNISDRTMDFGQITFAIRDKDNQLLATAQAYVQSDALAPGEMSTFTGLTSTPPGTDHFEIVNILWQWAE